MLNPGITLVISLYSAQEKPPVMAMLKGLKRLGRNPGIVAKRTDVIKTQKACCWGWRGADRLRARGHEVLVMERGYIGDRFNYTSLGWNGLNGHAVFPAYEDDGGKRFAEHGGVLKPWKSGGDYALILGQVPGDMSLKGQDMLPWYTEAALKIKKIHGLPIHFREHPVAVRKGRRITVPGAVVSTGDLSTALAGAAFTVCYNSNASVDSILAGIPCIVGDKGSMAWEMCGHDIGEIVRPEREAWAHKLAFTQWTPEEIEAGRPLGQLFGI